MGIAFSRGVAGVLIGTVVVGGAVQVTYCGPGEFCRREDVDQPHTEDRESAPMNTTYRFVANVASTSSVEAAAAGFRPFVQGMTK